MLELVGDGWRRELEPGDDLRFGRGGNGVDVVLADDPRLHRQCGLISVSTSGWSLHNTGRWLRIRVVSRDRFGLDSLVPGQRIRVPWSDARVQIHVGATAYEFSARFVSGGPIPADPEVGARSATDDEEDATTAPVRVDRRTGYFRALVALCEPQLVDPSSTEVATDLQIARRLNRTMLEVRPLTGKTVERRLDNCRERFGLKESDEHGLSIGLERRDARRVLVERAILTGTVTRRDLAVLAQDGAGDEPAAGD